MSWLAKELGFGVQGSGVTHQEVRVVFTARCDVVYFEYTKRN